MPRPLVPDARMLMPTLRLPCQEPEDLFETLSQCLLSGVDRDALSGWGAIVHVV